MACPNLQMVQAISAAVGRDESMTQPFSPLFIADAAAVVARTNEIDFEKEEKFNRQVESYKMR